MLPRSVARSTRTSEPSGAVVVGSSGRCVVSNAGGMARTPRRRSLLRLRSAPTPRSERRAAAIVEVLVSASVVFTNGPVHTVDARDTIASGVAVEGERIVAVGSDQDALAHAGPGTRRIDLRGRSLTPGFIDAHHHLTWLGSVQD